MRQLMQQATLIDTLPQKSNLISCKPMVHISYIKLLRTDTIEPMIHISNIKLITNWAI